MVRIQYYYRLNEGANMEEFRKWSVEVDQAITSKQPGVRKFEAYQVEMFGDGSEHFDAMELVEADSMEAWEKVGSYPAMAEVSEGFKRFVDNSSVLEIRLDKIE